MITGPQLFWVMLVDSKGISDEDARTCDGLWEGLDKEEKAEYNRKAVIINNIILG